jgi:hypothetical protein
MDPESVGCWNGSGPWISEAGLDCGSAGALGRTLGGGPWGPVCNGTDLELLFVDSVWYLRIDMPY